MIVQLAISKLRTSYEGPSKLPSSIADDAGIRIALQNCERQFNVLVDKLGPVLALVRGPRPDKMEIRDEI